MVDLVIPPGDPTILSLTLVRIIARFATWQSEFGSERLASRATDSLERKRAS